jgi:hypothetical protein
VWWDRWLGERATLPDDGGEALIEEGSEADPDDGDGSVYGHEVAEAAG